MCWRNSESDSIDKNKNQEVQPNKQSTAWRDRRSDSSNDKTTSRNQLRPLIKITLLSCSKETLEKNKNWNRLFRDLCQLWCLVLCNTWWNRFRTRGCLYGHGRGSELLFCDISWVLEICLWEICYIEAFSVLYAINICGGTQQHLGGL